MFKTIDKNVSAEIIEKKSKFIADVFYIESVEEAEKKIKEVRKNHMLARHNCYAFSVFTKEGVTNRFSDDGEPSGTAGSPMLNIITSKNLTNILVVVTRYFGGTLLGTGGLVRAYTGAFQEALNSCEEIKKDLGVNVKIVISYSELEKMKYYLKQKDIIITKIDYAENIDVYADMRKIQYDELLSNINDLNFTILDNKIMEEKYITINE